MASSLLRVRKNHYDAFECRVEAITPTVGDGGVGHTGAQSIGAVQGGHGSAVSVISE